VLVCEEAGGRPGGLAGDWRGEPQQGSHDQDHHRPWHG
jgi:hypothetical protein